MNPKLGLVGSLLAAGGGGVVATGIAAVAPVPVALLVGVAVTAAVVRWFDRTRLFYAGGAVLAVAGLAGPASTVPVGAVGVAALVLAFYRGHAGNLKRMAAAPAYPGPHERVRVAVASRLLAARRLTPSVPRPALVLALPTAALWGALLTGRGPQAAVTAGALVATLATLSADADWAGLDRRRATRPTLSVPSPSSPSVSLPSRDALSTAAVDLRSARSVAGSLDRATLVAAGDRLRTTLARTARTLRGLDDRFVEAFAATDVEAAGPSAEKITATSPDAGGSLDEGESAVGTVVETDAPDDPETDPAGDDDADVPVYTAVSGADTPDDPTPSTDGDATAPAPESAAARGGRAPDRDTETGGVATASAPGRGRSASSGSSTADAGHPVADGGDDTAPVERRTGRRRRGVAAAVAEALEGDDGDDEEEWADRMEFGG